MNNDSQTRTFQNLYIGCSKGVQYTISGESNIKLPSLTGTSGGIPLYGQKEGNTYYPLSITIYSPDCVNNNSKYVWFSGGSSRSINPPKLTKTSIGTIDTIPVCYGIKGYKSFPL